MKSNPACAALVVGGLLLLATALPAFAASPATETVVITSYTAKTDGTNTSHSATSIGGGVGMGALDMDNKDSGGVHNSALPVGGDTKAQRSGKPTLAGARPAAAQAFPAPGILSVQTECVVLGGKPNTVHVVTKGMTGNYVETNSAFTFHNLHTGMTQVFASQDIWTAHDFPVPSGAYDLVVFLASANQPTTPLPGRLQTVWHNINIPAFYLTGGKGTGCVFGTLAPIPLAKGTGVARARSGPAGE